MLPSMKNKNPHSHSQRWHTCSPRHCFGQPHCCKPQEGLPPPEGSESQSTFSLFAPVFWSDDCTGNILAHYIKDINRVFPAFGRDPANGGGRPQAFYLTMYTASPTTKPAHS